MSNYDIAFCRNNYQTHKTMIQTTTVLTEILALILGRKYYANIIHTRGTNPDSVRTASARTGAGAREGPRGFPGIPARRGPLQRASPPAGRDCSLRHSGSGARQDSRSPHSGAQGLWKVASQGFPPSGRPPASAALRSSRRRCFLLAIPSRTACCIAAAASCVTGTSL